MFKRRFQRRFKMLAVAMVLMLTLAALPIIGDEGGLEAAVGDGGSYSYTITYDPTAMSTTSAAISTADMTAISHTGTPTTLSSMNEGSWTWNTTTGLGPFNSFYGAFDIQNGNRFYAVLNPYDLTETISGQDLPTPLTRWNIMWVLPTVYVSSTSTTLTLSNDSSAGTAYAHTIDGHVYKYLAIGVYEGSTTTLDGQTVLTSTTGTMPAANATRAVFRGYAHNYAMSSTLNESSTYPAHSMLWNFDQWTLFKDICFATMEDFNSENTVGNGHVFTNNSTYSYQTGALNTSGPYAGLPAKITDDTTALSYGSDSVKLYIENAWGGVWDFVDGAVFDGRAGVYLDSSSNPTDAHTGTYVTYHTWPTAIQNGYPISIQTDTARVWGFQGSTVGGSDTTGTADYIWTSADADRVLGVGGDAWSDWSASVRYGLSASYVDRALSTSRTDIGSRLAFVFDADVLPKDLTFNMDPASGYGTLSGNSIADVPYYSNLTVSDNTLTANGTTITATPAAADAQYTYSFDGWYSNGTQLTGTTTITDDMTITAHFSRVVNTYNVSVSSSNPQYGTVTLVGNISNTPYGSVIHLSGTNNNILTLNGSVVTATAADPTAYYTYSFDGYTNSGVLVQDGDIITGATTLIANFGSTAIYTVLITPNESGWGTVTVDQIIGVPTGSDFTVTDNVIEIYSTESTATPSAATVQYTYGFDNFTIGGVEVETGTTISSDTTVIVNFTRTVNEYTVYVESNDTDWGTVSAASFSDVPYGSTVTVDGSTLTIGSDSISATIVGVDDAQYTYGFDGWYIGATKIGSSGATTDENTTITAVFTRTVNEYTITWELYDDLTATTEVEYGTVPEYTPAMRPGYSFVGWDPTPVEVTGTATYTAIWSELPPITVTFDGNGGSPSFSFKEVFYGQPYGNLPTAHMTNMQLVGWFTDPTDGDQIYPDTIVDSQDDLTLYAHYRKAEFYSTVLTVIDLIPMICVIAIIFGLIGTALYRRGA